MAKNTKERSNSKFENWVAEKTAGKEKLYTILLLVIAFVVMAVVIALRLNEEPAEQNDYDLNILPKTTTKASESSENLIQQYRTIDHNKELIELLEQYEILLSEEPMDTIAVMNLQSKLKKYQKHYEKN